MPATTEVRVRVPQKAEASWHELNGRVHAVRRRHAFKFAVQGMLLGVAIFAAAFLGFSAVDIFFKLSVSSRIVWLAVAVGGLVGAVFLAAVRPFARLGGRVRTAREIEGAFPELENQLSTTLEYGADKDLIETSGSELVGELIRRTEARTEPLDFGRTVRWRKAVLAFLLAALIGGLVGLYGLISPRLFLATWQRFLQPTASIAPPTLTVIEKIEPGSGSYPVESSITVSATLGGRLPETATLMLRREGDAEDRWEERVMECAPDGSYQASLRRLLETTHFKVRANDDESDVYTLRVYREPQIDEFSVRLEYPAYTRRTPETLPPGVGDVSALRGTKITVDLKANTELAVAKAVFGSKRDAVEAESEGRTGRLTFELKEDDQYQLRIEDHEGHANDSPSSYRLKALKDHPPRVRIRKPARDLMVHREQTVKIEITASDDLGVGEIGIMHSLGLEEAKTMVRRLDPDAPQTSVEGKHKWELGPLGLKGGEVIAYYAYALDNDTLTGPKTAKSQLHFLTVYDEEEYDSAQQQKQQGQPTPESVKQLDKMIETQKKLLQETFALARSQEAFEKQEPTERAQKASAKTAKAQRELKTKVEELAAAVERELQGMGPVEERPEGEDPPRERPLGEEELAHMRSAADKMDNAAGKLDETQPAPAVRPEMEALRELSETRRLLLSDKEGDPRFKMAMENQSKKKKKSRQDQQRQDQAQAQKEMQQMPPMMEREKELEREIERLEELKPRLRQPEQPQTAEDQQREEEKQKERRELKRKVEQELQQLAEEAKERAENLEELANRMEQMRAPAEKAQDAAKKFDQAQQSAKQDQNEQAKEQAHQAARDLQDAHREIRSELQKQFRQQLQNLKNDAQDLAQRQQDMAQATRDMLQQAQQQQQSKQPQSQQQNGEPQSQQSQQKPGEKKGEPQSQQKPGEKKGQQPAQQQQPGQQSQASGQPDPKAQTKMKSMARRQGELAGDLKDLAERLEAAAQQAEGKQLPSAKSLREAEAQARPDAPADQSAQSAQDALAQGKGEKAQEEQERAAREMENMARSIEKAIQKTEAADMKALSEALQKARALTREQEQVNEALAQGKPATDLAEREEKVADASKDLAAEAKKLETLRRQHRAGNAREQLQRASQQATEAADEMRAGKPDEAKKPADRAEQALNAAVNEMERAAGQRLEDAARKAQQLAKQTRENQERASEAARKISEPKDGKPLSRQEAEQRDQSAEQERTAARKARQLEQALEGLEEMSKEIQPAAAQIAQQARETSQDAKLAQRMEELARDLQEMGTPKAKERGKQPTPTEAAQEGDRLAKTAKQIERQLDQFAAEANGTPLDRLRALEQEAKANAKEAERLAKEAKEAKPEQAKPLSEEAGKLEKDLKRFEPKLNNLEPGAPEKRDLEKAREATREAQKQIRESKGKNDKQPGSNGGAALDKAKKHLDKMSSGLTQRMERILKAREIQPDDDEVAPKEYRTLVDQYYRALSEDVEEKR